MVTVFLNKENKAAACSSAQCSRGGQHESFPRASGGRAKSWPIANKIHDIGCEGSLTSENLGHPCSLLSFLLCSSRSLLNSTSVPGCTQDSPLGNPLGNKGWKQGPRVIPYCHSSSNTLTHNRHLLLQNQCWGPLLCHWGPWGQEKQRVTLQFLWNASFLCSWLIPFVRPWMESLHMNGATQISIQPCSFLHLS